MLLQHHGLPAIVALNRTIVYDAADELRKKMGKVAKNVCHASKVVADTAIMLP